jgi:maltose O-acetyltransferase
MKRIFKFIISKFIKLLPLIAFPRFNVFLFKLLGYEIHKTAKIYSSVSIIGDIKVKIGYKTHVGNETIITGGDAKIIIGNNCDISDKVSIVCGTHEISREGIKAAGKDVGKDIIIENGVWIGYGAIILPGVKIGEKSIIGAGSLVNKDVPSGVIVAGNPARLIVKNKI